MKQERESGRRNRKFFAYIDQCLARIEALLKVSRSPALSSSLLNKLHSHRFAIEL
jgi:hypothetical protein